MLHFYIDDTDHPAFPAVAAVDILESMELLCGLRPTEERLRRLGRFKHALASTEDQGFLNMVADECIRRNAVRSKGDTHAAREAAEPAALVLLAGGSIEPVGVDGYRIVGWSDEIEGVSEDVHCVHRYVDGGADQFRAIARLLSRVGWTAEVPDVRDAEG